MSALSRILVGTICGGRRERLTIDENVVFVKLRNKKPLSPIDEQVYDSLTTGSKLTERERTAFTTLKAMYSSNVVELTMEDVRAINALRNRNPMSALCRIRSGQMAGAPRERLTVDENIVFAKLLHKQPLSPSDEQVFDTLTTGSKLTERERIAFKTMKARYSFNVKLTKEDVRALQNLRELNPISAMSGIQFAPLPGAPRERLTVDENVVFAKLRNKLPLSPLDEHVFHTITTGSKLTPREKTAFKTMKARYSFNVKLTKEDVLALNNLRQLNPLSTQRIPSNPSDSGGRSGTRLHGMPDQSATPPHASKGLIRSNIGTIRRERLSATEVALYRKLRKREIALTQDEEVLFANLMSNPKLRTVEKERFRKLYNRYEPLLHKEYTMLDKLARLSIAQQQHEATLEDEHQRNRKRRATGHPLELEANETGSAIATECSVPCSTKRARLDPVDLGRATCIGQDGGADSISTGALDTVAREMQHHPQLEATDATDATLLPSDTNTEAPKNAGWKRRERLSHDELRLVETLKAGESLSGADLIEFGVLVAGTKLRNEERVVFEKAQASGWKSLTKQQRAVFYTFLDMHKRQPYQSPPLLITQERIEMGSTGRILEKFDDDELIVFKRLRRFWRLYPPQEATFRLMVEGEKLHIHEKDLFWKLFYRQEHLDGNDKSAIVTIRARYNQSPTDPVLVQNRRLARAEQRRDMSEAEKNKQVLANRERSARRRRDPNMRALLKNAQRLRLRSRSETRKRHASKCTKAFAKKKGKVAAAADPVAEPIVDGEASPVDDPVVDGTAEPVAEAVDDPAVDPVADPTLAPAIDHVYEPVLNPIIVDDDPVPVSVVAV